LQPRLGGLYAILSRRLRSVSNHAGASAIASQRLCPQSRLRAGGAAQIFGAIPEHLRSAAVGVIDPDVSL
jgi:hypothetical protein